MPGDVKFNYFDAEGNMQDISVEDLTKGKKVSSVKCICVQCPVLLQPVLLPDWCCVYTTSTGFKAYRADTHMYT